MNTNSQTLAPLLLVTGVSGAGKSSALGVLEDLGYEAVDNLPVSLIGRLLGDGEFPHPIAIGIDIRTRDFNAPGFLEELNVLFSRPDMDVNLLFLDCDDEILGRRFEDVGVAALLFTDVGRDGLLKGCNVEATVDLARAVRIPVIASGGVKGLDDIHVLSLYANEGIEGVITGRALYDGRLDLAAALAMAARQ